MTTKPILELDNISKSFNGVAILKNISLAIREGEAIGIIGPSGCGKSTLFRILLGQYKPNTGTITYKDRTLHHGSKQLQLHTGYATQDDSFYMKLTVFENMTYYATLFHVRKGRTALKNHILSILSDVRLSHAKDIMVEALSGGMRRRLSFALALLHDPEILVLDEPTAGLDASLVKQFWNIVKQTQKKGKTIIVASHMLSEIEKHCDRVAIILEGRIVALVPTTKKNIEKLFEKVIV